MRYFLPVVLAACLDVRPEADEALASWVDDGLVPEEGLPGAEQLPPPGVQ